MARKTKYTQDRVEKILSAIRKGKTYRAASLAAGINPDTFFEWLKNKPDFSDAVKKAELEYENWYNEHLVGDAKKSLLDLICGMEQITTKTKTYTKYGKTITETIEERKSLPPNPTAIIFALCNRDPEHWQNRVNTELSGKVETESKSKISLANVPDSLLAQVIESIYQK